MEHTFDTPRPITASIEIASGAVDITASDTDTTQLRLTGRGADEATVSFDDDTLVVRLPLRTGFLSNRHSVDVELRLPAGSDLAVKVAAADVTARGLLRNARVSTASGDIELEDLAGQASIRTGSGHIEIGAIEGEADVKTGSGRVRVDRLAATSRIATGSGDIQVGRAAAGVSLKSGSGDLTVVEADGDVSLAAASGDLEVGSLRRGRATLRNVSGDIALGVAAGTPVWTQVSTATGAVRSTLPPTGAPADGQDHVEVEAVSVTGDIHLHPLQTA